jgi:hypothetical protein
MEKVIGRRMAIVPTGPIPGSTPIRVPINTPIKQEERLVGVNAVLKPKRRWVKASISFLFRIQGTREGALSLE